MDDRELTEAAAKAAGFGKPYEWNHWPRQDKPTFIDEHNGIVSFDPLRDDADAFRLAVHLDISLKQQFAMVMAEYPWRDEEFNTRKILCESVLDDHCAASRRAIVRAAVEMGKVGAPQAAG